MSNFSLTISEIYNRFLPLAEQNGISLNLDIVDSDIIAEELANVKTDIEQAISTAIDRSKQGKISIQVKRGEITISDTGTTLSRPLCDLLSRNRKHVSVTSRVGFGTKVKIQLNHTGKAQKTDSKPKKSQS